MILSYLFRQQVSETLTLLHHNSIWIMKFESGSTDTRNSYRCSIINLRTIIIRASFESDQIIFYPMTVSLIRTYSLREFAEVVGCEYQKHESTCRFCFFLGVISSKFESHNICVMTTWLFIEIKVNMSNFWMMVTECKYINYPIFIYFKHHCHNYSWLLRWLPTESNT